MAHRLRLAGDSARTIERDNLRALRGQSLHNMPADISAAADDHDFHEDILRLYPFAFYYDAVCKLEGKPNRIELRMRSLSHYAIRELTLK